uniref:Uncharacterized protein n=1 Tax=Nelumbo nucifera TaxID=4432 RepID=A0A822YCN2_NELNU|nr:TPA_asm: hypothetical protein HUJ06_031560 [Nelumbo nucifera]
MGIADRLRRCLPMLDCITNMLHLQQLHAHIIKTAMDTNPLALHKLLAFLSIADNGDLNYACLMLTHVENPTHFMWNTIIRGFSQSQEPEKALLWYSIMTNKGGVGVLPDKFTFPFLLKACSRLLDLRTGQQVHCQIVKLGLLLDLHVESSLLYFYTSCGELDLAKTIFYGLGYRSFVTWNSMISGCVRSERWREALRIFCQMRLDNQSPDQFSLVSVASACANIGAVFLGKWVHGLACRSGFCEVVPLGNALVDMYGKCGSFVDACKLFDEMAVRTIVSWSTMIDVCAMHGRGTHALYLLNEMKRVGIRPDDMTFTSILCACSHSGLLQEGKMWFDRMIRDYGVEPKVQHYGCMVELLGKAGQIEEAYSLISEMPIEPDAAVWRSLVGACLFHGDLKLAEIAAGRLRLLDPDDAGDLVMLSNVFATSERWGDVERLRRGARKSFGYSFIEVNNVVHEFVTRDTSHPQACSIYLLMDQMVGQLRWL